MRFDGKIVLITGGTSGIGRAAARLFHEEGARVVVVGLDPYRLEQTGRELGPDIMAVRADLRHLGEIDGLIRMVRESLGSLDVLFANAGAGAAAPLEAVTEEQVDEQLAVNFKGVFFIVQKAVPILAKGSSIVLTTSFLDAVGTPGLSVLSAAKAAVRSLVRCLAAELAPRGIRVNAVCPGPISTPFYGKLGFSDDELDRIAATIEAKVPLQRFGEAEEVAKAVLFLASADASFITGAEIVVDGGVTQL